MGRHISAEMHRYIYIYIYTRVNLYVELYTYLKAESSMSWLEAIAAQSCFIV